MSGGVAGEHLIFGPEKSITRRAMEPAYVRSTRTRPHADEIKNWQPSMEPDPAAGTGLAHEEKRNASVDYQRETKKLVEHINHRFRVVEDALTHLTSKVTTMDKRLEDIASLLITLRNIPLEPQAPTVKVATTFMCRIGDEICGSTEKLPTEIRFSLCIPRAGDILVSDAAFHDIDYEEDESLTFAIEKDTIEGHFEKREDKYYLCLKDVKEYPLKFGFSLKF